MLYMVLGDIFELLNGEIFYSLREVQITMENGETLQHKKTPQCTVILSN